MARRFSSFDGLGPCSIVLRGVAADERGRALLLQQASTDRIFVGIATNGTKFNVPVTSIPFAELVRCLNRYEWSYAFPAVEESLLQVASGR